jgi:hypothetical protein
LYDSKEPTPNTTTSSNDGVFVNHGLERWEKLRAEWKSSSFDGPKVQPAPKRRTERKELDLEDILDRIFNGRDGSMALPEPIPLPDMIEILLGVWEADGLYD